MEWRFSGLSIRYIDLRAVLDHDDVLLPGALAALAPLFTAHRIHWAVGQADDLLTDGSRKAYPPALPFGLIRAGHVNDWAIANAGNWPLHCAGLMMRATSLRAVGGWSGTPADDDTAMFAALSEAGDGYHLETLTWLYRQHPDQTTRTKAWRDRSDDGRRLALQRVAAVRMLKMGFAPDVNLDLASTNSSRVEVGPALKEAN